MVPQSKFISRAGSQGELTQSADSLQARGFHWTTARLREALSRNEKPNVPSTSDQRVAGDDMDTFEHVRDDRIPSHEADFPSQNYSAEGIREDRRKVRRQRAGVPVHIHQQDGRVGETFVLELNELGCRLFQTGPALERFSRLGLWFGEIGPIRGKVCWSVGGVSGIEFSTPMNPVIVDRITKS